MPVAQELHPGNVVILSHLFPSEDNNNIVVVNKYHKSEKKIIIFQILCCHLISFSL